MSQYWIQTKSGTQFDYVDLEPDMIKITDIAWALVEEKRYVNHTTIPVPVLEHSLNVSRLLSKEVHWNKLPANLSDAEYRRLELIGHLHDGSEAYTGDLPSPLKRLCSGFKLVENRISDAIYLKYLGSAITAKEKGLLDLADWASLEDECERFLHGGLNFLGKNVSKNPGFPYHFTPQYGLSKVEAMYSFLQRFNNLMGL